MYVVVVQPKRYGFWKFIGDCFMVFITWGLWLIWIFVREMRKRNQFPYEC
jgi:hypothetical protein